ncbi:hypothetical protein BS17DRAFT_736128 [Gyrodon lividus]|nr:hypothetical protein BS17DRAFT_736128 [Gyrodon lividus]
MLAPTLTQSIDVLRLFSVKDPVPLSWYLCHLVDLPTELLIAVFLHANHRTILRCRSVCRKFKDVIDASVELQYRIELALDGMIDGPSSLFSTGERLSRLRSLRRSWSTLSWTSKVTVPMPGACYAYELVGGIFCKTQNAQHQPHGSRQLSATWLPPSDGPGHVLVREDIGVPTRDFAMDPSQDLMVLFRGSEDFGLPLVVVVPGTLELYIRTISTNQVHPEARVPVLSTPVLFPVTSAFIQIVDDVIGMLYCVDPAKPRITIWNWKTGNLVVDRSSVNLPAATWDFSFINSRAFFLTCGGATGSIEIFTFSCDCSSSDQPQPAPVVHVASLRLATLLPSVRIVSLNTHTGPFLAGCPCDKPFTASNEDRIHMIILQYLDQAPTDGPRAPRWCVFLHNRTLEAYIRRQVVEKESGRMPVVVPWEAWGRMNTRMLPHNGMFKWLRYVHGQRVIVPSMVGPGKSRMQVLDFNFRDHDVSHQRPYTIPDIDSSDPRCGLGADLKTGGGDSGSSIGTRAERSLVGTQVEIVDYPTRIELTNFFAENVETCLPFRSTTRDVMANYSGVMIDDERLVGLKDGAFSTGDMKEIDVFTM